MDGAKPDIANVFPADGKNARELDFDETNFIALFQKKNYKVKMCVGITSKLLRPSVRVIDTGVRLNKFRTTFFFHKRCKIIRPIYKVSLRSASHYLVQMTGKITLFVQVCNPLVCGNINFGDLDQPIVQLVVKVSLLGRFLRRNLPMEQGIVPIWSSLDIFISEYTLLSDLLAASQTDSDAGINIGD